MADDASAVLGAPEIAGHQELVTALGGQLT
jgi:hypothetical protein